MLAKLTVHPNDFGPADVDAVRRLGVTDNAIRDAICVCALFNIATRCADTLGFDPSTASGQALARFGYAAPPRP